MFALKLFVWVALAIGGIGYAGYYESSNVVEQRRDLYLRQFENDDSVPQAIRRDYWNRESAYTAGVIGWVVLGALFFGGDAARVIRRR